MNVTIFKASRTVAREYAKQVEGKVKDMGPDAPAGERWAVLFTKPDDVQVVDLPLVAAEPEDLKGMPNNDIPAAATACEKQYNREVLRLNAKVKPRNLNKGTMKNRKGNMVEVQFKRSKIAVAMKG